MKKTGTKTNDLIKKITSDVMNRLGHGDLISSSLFGSLAVGALRYVDTNAYSY